MHSLALLGLSALAAASVSPPVQLHSLSPQPSVEDIAPEITVVETNTSYAVKLECVACPYPIWNKHKLATWAHPPPNNSLMLKLNINKAGNALLLDGQPILPLDPMPVYINAVQIATNISVEDMNQQIDRGSYSDMPKRQTWPLQYEHTIFRAEQPGYLWLQFNVTGLPFGETIEPFRMGQNVVQILLQEKYESHEIDGKTHNGYTLSIADIGIVEAKDRVQPPKMKCGKLAMVQNAFDPNEWDQYGKLGTWSRTVHLIIAKLSSYWSDHIQSNPLLLPLALFLAIIVVMARRLYQFRQQQEQVYRDMDAETALLGSDAPPPYLDIPVIKIEEYD